MKIINIIFIVALSLFVVACTAPPSDVPAAVVIEDNDVEETGSTPDITVDEESESDVNEVLGTDDSGEDTIVEASAVDTLAIDKEASTFVFEGYGPGKSHEGTFDTWEGTLRYENNVLVGASGTIQANSVNTGIGGLDNHLQSDDFFDVEMYPEITVEFITIGDTQATADLTFRGVTKTISFPVELNGESINTDFLLDITDFNMKYVGIDDQVRIAFEFTPVA